MNQATVLGRLTRDPDIKVTQSGMTVARFTLAVDRPHKKGQQGVTDWIRCVAFGHTAEAIGNYVYKGQRLLVEGEIHTGSYTDKNGQKVNTTDVAVNHAEFIEKRENTQQSYQAQGNGHSSFEQFGTVVNNQQSNSGNQGGPAELPFDEEIPF